MNRLTYCEDDGIHIIHQTILGRKDTSADALAKAISRLAAYEDTDLTPEEIGQMQDEIIKYHATNLAPDEIMLMQDELERYRKETDR